MIVKSYFWLIVVLGLACSASGVAAQVSSGTAFAVAPGFLITNQHVIAGCSSVDVFAADGRRTGSIVDADEEIDLALLRVSGIKGATARLRTPRNVRLGESVMVFGFPLTGALSSSGNFTSGLVSALRGLRDAAGELQITAPVQPGNSGGPLMDASGLIIGVVQAKLDALRSAVVTGDIPQNINFAISLEVVADFLTKHNVAFREGVLSTPLETTRVAELAQSFTYRVECRHRSQSAAVVPKIESKPDPKPDANKGSQSAVEAPKIESRPYPKLNSVTSLAAAPACSVGLKLEFQYSDGRTTTRTIASNEDGVCVVEQDGKSYYDKDWTLVKQILANGKVVTKSEPSAPLVGEKLLPFPLTIGKAWAIDYTGLNNRRNTRFYKNSYSVQSFEEITVPAGSFSAFKIRQEQINTASRRWGVRYLWYVTELGFFVKRKSAPNESVDASYWSPSQDYELISVSRPN